MAKSKQLQVSKEVEEIKGEKKMENEFNYFNYVKFLVLKEYYKLKLQNKDTNEIKYQVKFNDTRKNGYFFKTGAFKFVKWETTFTEEGKQVTEVTIKDINIEAKATSKEGKEFNVFTAKDRAKAFASAEKSI